jgi:hypothetical protein
MELVRKKYFRLGLYHIEEEYVVKGNGLKCETNLHSRRCLSSSNSIISSSAGVIWITSFALLGCKVSDSLLDELGCFAQFLLCSI